MYISISKSRKNLKKPIMPVIIKTFHRIVIQRRPVLTSVSPKIHSIEKFGYLPLSGRH